MRKVKLGRTGLEVSAVGFGGIPIQRVSTAGAVAAIQTALDLGVNFIDTAAGYSDSQAKIGVAIAGRREGLVLASKSPQRTAKGVLADIETARRQMGVEHIELYQLHNVADRASWDAVRAPDGAIAGLRQAVQRGWIGHIGVTSHSLDMALEMVESGLFETMQFPFNLVTSEPAQRLIPRCRELGVGFIVMKPLCGGQYDNAELAFKYLNAFPDVVPIPGIESPAEIIEIARIVEGGEVLQGAQKRQADEIAQRLGKVFCRRCQYCMPCPQGIAVANAMIFDSFVARFPAQKLKDGPARQMADSIPRCTQCGACEEKCPYKLPIRQMLQQTLQKAQALLEG
jgi:predicted aldo/keto reductase-like oxidoreductase